MFALRPICINHVVWCPASRPFYALLCDTWLKLTLSSKNRTINQKEIRNKEESENN